MIRIRREARQSEPGSEPGEWRPTRRRTNLSDQVIVEDADLSDASYMSSVAGSPQRSSKKPSKFRKILFPWRQAQKPTTEEVTEPQGSDAQPVSGQDTVPGEKPTETKSFWGFWRRRQPQLESSYFSSYYSYADSYGSVSTLNIDRSYPTKVEVFKYCLF